jgi:hypothetical protein
LKLEHATGKLNWLIRGIAGFLIRIGLIPRSAGFTFFAARARIISPSATIILFLRLGFIIVVGRG